MLCNPLISWNFWRRYLTPSWINIKTGHYCGFMMPRWKIIGMYFLFSHLQLPQYNIPLPKPLTELVTRYITRNAINLPLQLLYFSPLPNIMWKSILFLATTLLYYTKYVFLIVSGYIQILHCGIVGGCQLQKLHPTSSSLHMWKWLFFLAKISSFYQPHHYFFAKELL